MVKIGISNNKEIIRKNEKRKTRNMEKRKEQKMSGKANDGKGKTGSGWICKKCG